MKNPYFIIYLMLIAFITLNAYLQGLSLTPLFLIIAGIKFYLIASYFMNYRQAHPLWKLLIYLMSILILLLLFFTTRI